MSSAGGASSSSSTRTTDLLVKVRYPNPLPPPPFPPRLLHYKTAPARTTTYDFLQPLCEERQVGIILDGELGMPLEYGKVRKGEYGDGLYFSGDRSTIAPPVPATTELDEDDLFLLTEASTSQPIGANGSSAGMASTPGGGAGLMGERRKVDVAWLRRTEYLSSEAGSKLSPASSAPSRTRTPLVQEELGPPTRERRVAAIENTFTAIQSTPLADLRHPTKKNLRPVEEYLVVPDEAMWANTMSIVKFGEDPGEGRAVGRTGPDTRLPRAIFRPLEVDNKIDRIGFYLPDDEDIASGYEDARRRDGAIPAPENEAFEFRYVRDYEVAKRKELSKEFVFSFIEDQPAPGQDLPSTSHGRQKGAYYGTIASHRTMRKRRPNRGDKPEILPRYLLESGIDFWHGMTISVGGLDAMDMPEEKENREALQDEVMKPPTTL